MLSLTVNGVSYSYPQNGDNNWGDGASNWASAVTSGMLQKAGGNFTLTADANFGPNFGLLSQYFTTRSSNASTSGVVRFANNEGLGWRNFANGANKILKVNASDQLEYDGAAILSSASITNNRALVANGSGQIASSTVTDTELGRLSGIGSSAVGVSDTQTLTNKTLTDTLTTVQNNSDNTKKLKFDVSAISAGTTRTYAVPDASTTLVGTDATQTLTNKTIAASSNTLSQLDYSGTVRNLSLAISVGSNILTIAAKDSSGSDCSATSKGYIACRNSTASTGTYNLRTITAAQSLAISQWSTLGHASGVACNAFVYEMDSDGSGAMKLCVAGVPYDEGSLQTAIKESFTGTVTIASPGVWTANSHGLNNNDAVILTTSGALPTGLSVNTKYYVVSTAANTFQLAATIGGSAINTSGTQSGTHTIHVASPRLVSDAVYSSKPVRLIGRFVSNQTTAGTWAAAPTEISLHPFQIPLIDACYATTAGQAITAIVQIVDMATKDDDPYNLVVTGSSWKFLAPLAGKYTVSVGVATASTSWSAGDEPGFLLLYKNGSVLKSFGHLRAQRTATDVYSWDGAVTVALAQNDYLDLRISSGASYNLNTTSGYCYISIVYEGQ